MEPRLKNKVEVVREYGDIPRGPLLPGAAQPGLPQPVDELPAMYSKTAAPSRSAVTPSTLGVRGSSFTTTVRGSPRRLRAASSTPSSRRRRSARAPASVCRSLTWHRRATRGPLPRLLRARYAVSILRRHRVDLRISRRRHLGECRIESGDSRRSPRRGEEGPERNEDRRRNVGYSPATMSAFR